VYCKILDDTPPTLADVTNNNPLNLLATSSYSYILGISANGGAPTKTIGYQKELPNTQSFSSVITDTSSPWG